MKISIKFLLQFVLLSLIFTSVATTACTDTHCTTCVDITICTVCNEGYFVETVGGVAKCTQCNAACKTCTAAAIASHNDSVSVDLFWSLILPAYHI